MPVTDAVALLGERPLNGPEIDVVLVNRSYLRGVDQVDRRTVEATRALIGPRSAVTDRRATGRRLTRRRAGRQAPDRTPCAVRQAVEARPTPAPEGDLDGCAPAGLRPDEALRQDPEVLGDLLAREEVDDRAALVGGLHQLQAGRTG